MSGVLWSDTYGYDAAKKENRFQMVLESPMSLNKVKSTNIRRICNTYLKLHGYLNTEKYGRTNAHTTPSCELYWIKSQNAILEKKD